MVNVQKIHRRYVQFETFLKTERIHAAVVYSLEWAASYSSIFLLPTSSFVFLQRGSDVCESWSLSPFLFSLLIQHYNSDLHRHFSYRY